MNVNSNTKHQLWKYVEVTCTNLVLIRIRKKINNDKRRKEGAVDLCLTLIIKELKFIVEHDRVVTTLNITKHYILYLVYCATILLDNNYLFSIYYIAESQWIGRSGQEITGRNSRLWENMPHVMLTFATTT